MALIEDRRTHETDDGGQALIPEARELQRRRRWRRGGGGLLAAALLAGGGIVLANGGGGGGSHASVASVGVHGPLPAGIAARAADPAGGPPWGIRVVHTTGYTCVQLGRLRGGQLGLLGRDGLAGNTMGPSTTYQARCAPNDGGGHAYMTIELGAQPASAAGGGYRGESMCNPPSEAAGLARVRARLAKRGFTRIGGTLSMPICPASDLRFVQYGLLGPHATSISYRISGASGTERTGPDGAYLVVGGPSTPAFCRQFPAGTSCGGNGVGPSEISGGMIQAVHYRNAPSCRLSRPSSRLPAWLIQCPRIGYVPAKPTVTARQVASPITVRALPGAGPFCGNDQGRLWYVCGPGEIPLEGTTGIVVLNVSFTARVASGLGGYTVQVEYPHNCGGSGGGIKPNIRQGQRVTLQPTLQPRCFGTFHGTVSYVPNTGPGPQFVGGPSGEPGAISVGTFTYRLNALPRPTSSTPNGTLNGDLSVCCRAPGQTREAGTIVVHGTRGTQRYAYTDQSGHFTVSLPPGSYRVVGGIPQHGWKIGRCQPSSTSGKTKPPRSLTEVTSNHTTTIAVICQRQ